MSAQLQRPGISSERDGLDKLLAEAVAALEAMNPRERDSLRAAQTLSFVLGQTMPSEHDSRGRLTAVIVLLEQLCEALQNPESTNHHFGHLIRQLQEPHRRDLIQRVEGFIEQISALLQGAEFDDTE